MNDFFLMERAAQIQRLRAPSSGSRIEIPGRMSRVGHSGCARRLFHTIDQICAIQLQEKRAKWLARLAQRGIALLIRRRHEAQDTDEALLLTASQRNVLGAFERQAVEFVLEETWDSPPTDSVVMPILRDQANFNGLKPMQFHSDRFAHELLFPSWLNLYTSLILAAPESSTPRFTTKQVKSIFDCLSEFEAAANRPDLAELLGALTLVANRCPPNDARVFVQQLLNLSSAKGQRASSDIILRLREANESAAGFLQVLKSWVVFETSALGELVQTVCDLDVETPRYHQLPEFISAQIRAAGEVEGAYERWAGLLAKISRFSQRGGSVAPEYAEFLEQRGDELDAWLSFLAPDNSERPLSTASQRLLVQLATSAQTDPAGPVPGSIQAFAQVLAPRLDYLHIQFSALFEKEFIKNDANRSLLLRCIEDDAQRRQVSQRLLAHAKKSNDRNRILGRMTIAAVIDPEYDTGKLGAIGRTTCVLKALEENGFISSNQLEELAGDVRRRLPESIEFLAAPHLGASGQEGRLARLYLALYEECEKFEHYGETGNFGLTTAAYGNLNRTIDRDV